jgi:type IV pilus assembly protein PilN
MRISLNLASQPYIDLRAVLKRLRILMAALAAVSLLLWLFLRVERGKAAAAVAHAEAMANNVRRLQQQQESYQALMRQPKNAAVLTQADFLNSLFHKKAFSWTATMTDLETVLPGGVQVMSIDPEVAKNGTVIIHMRVGGARDRAVELVSNLEKSRHFIYPKLANESLAQQASGGPNAIMQPVSASAAVNFDILAQYRGGSDMDTGKTDAGNKGPDKKDTGKPEDKKSGNLNPAKAVGKKDLQPGTAPPKTTGKRGPQ